MTERADIVERRGAVTVIGPALDSLFQTIDTQAAEILRLRAALAMAERERPPVAQIAAIIQRWQDKPLTTAEISQGAAAEIAGARAVPFEQRVEAAARAISLEMWRVLSDGDAAPTTLDRDMKRIAEAAIRASDGAAESVSPSRTPP